NRHPTGLRQSRTKVQDAHDVVAGGRRHELHPAVFLHALITGDNVVRAPDHEEIDIAVGMRDRAVHGDDDALALAKVELAIVVVPLLQVINRVLLPFPIATADGHGDPDQDAPRAAQQEQQAHDAAEDEADLDADAHALVAFAPAFSN